MQSTLAIPNGTNSNSGPKLPLPIWARLVLGSFLCLAAPICKKVLRIEDGVEKAIETIAEEVIKVAEVVEKVAVSAENALPDGSSLKEKVLEAEQIAEAVEKDAEEAEELIKELDKTKADIEAYLEHLMEEWEVIDHEDTEVPEQNKTTDPSPNL